MAKRPVPKYDFKAFGAAIKTARTGRKESRKGDEHRINIYHADESHPHMELFFDK